VKEKAYIFGGETAAGKFASNEVHVINLDADDKTSPAYSVIPAVPHVEGGKVPVARTRHAACAFNICVAVFGGTDENDKVIEENFIWLFNAGKSAWEILDGSKSGSAPQPRRDAHLYNHKNNLVLYGGVDAKGQVLTDVWYYSYVENIWTALPEAPISTSNAVVSDGVLYLLSGSEDISGDLHSLPITPASAEEQVWSHREFPANPLTPGPKARAGAELIPISTGYGRQYLLYMFGKRAAPPSSDFGKEGAHQPQGEAQNNDLEFHSDMWTYQLPSSNLEARANIYEALKPAKIKDAIRGALGMDDGKHSWAEVEVVPTANLDVTEGKLHPGPRASFAADVMKDGVTVVLWGGVNPKDEREGDGWMIKLE
jgi:hypothetical protein